MLDLGIKLINKQEYRIIWGERAAGMSLETSMLPGGCSRLLISLRTCLHSFYQVFDPFGGCGTTLFLKVLVNCVLCFRMFFGKVRQHLFFMGFVSFLSVLLVCCGIRGDIRNNVMTEINVGKGEAERAPVLANPGVGSAMILNLAVENILY